MLGSEGPHRSHGPPSCDSTILYQTSTLPESDVVDGVDRPLGRLEGEAANRLFMSDVPAPSPLRRCGSSCLFPIPARHAQKMQCYGVALTLEIFLEESLEHRTRWGYMSEEGGAGLELHVVGISEYFVSGFALYGQGGLATLRQAPPQNGVVEISLRFFNAFDRIALGGRTGPSPSNWGNMYHIQCERFRPLRTSERARA